MNEQNNEFVNNEKLIQNWITYGQIIFGHQNG